MRWKYYDPWKYDDPHVQAHMMRAEEMLEEARAHMALQALLRDSRAPRRPARVWLGSILLALGHRLLRSVPTLRAAQSPDEIRGMEP